MSKNEELGGTEPRGISRRTVAIGAAWAVPVIALATASPAFAASGGTLNFSGAGCKFPGNATDNYKGYVFALTAANTTDFDVTVTITSVTLAGSNLGAVTVVNINGVCVNLGNPFTIPHDTAVYGPLALVTTDAGNSSSGTLVVNYTLSSGGGTQQVTTQASGTNPLTKGGGSCDAFNKSQQDCLLSLNA